MKIMLRVEQYISMHNTNTLESHKKNTFGMKYNKHHKKWQKRTKQTSEQFGGGFIIVYAEWLLGFANQQMPRQRSTG